MQGYLVVCSVVGLLYFIICRYYAPALGFLMFAVGVNLSIEDFKHAVERPGPIALGLAGQYVLKPLLGVVVATLSVRFLPLPEAVGKGKSICN
jgi:predicted Na+-dependent transporter